MVDIGQDYVTISDKHGEIVHWVEDEWIEDPSVTISIASAIQIYYQQGSKELRAILDKEVEDEEEIPWEHDSIVHKNFQRDVL